MERHKVADFGSSIPEELITETLNFLKKFPKQEEILEHQGCYQEVRDYLSKWAKSRTILMIFF